jgi:hypothetical protein
VFAMPIRGEVPIALAPVEKIRRSVGIWDKIQALGKHKGLLAVCAVIAIGLATLVGLVFATVTSSGSVALFTRPPAEAPARAQIHPLQMMMNSKDLPAAHNDDYSLVFN